MSLRQQVFKGVAVIGAGQVFSQALSFVRNMIVARLIAPADFGIAATFTITVSLFEAISDISADKLIIQAQDGDSEALQSTAQLWLFIRGVCCAAMVALMAWPVSTLFKVPQARWAFYWLALVPLLRGLMNLDVKRLQRRMRFGPQVFSEFGSQVLVTILAWPLARTCGDFSAVLWLVLVQTAALVMLSHILAERPYRWAWDRDKVRRLFSFGWPLLINGLLMFGILQGDRFIIGAGYSMYDLGLYSAAVVLASAPAMLFGSIGNSLFLPLLSGVQKDIGTFRHRYGVFVALLALFSGILAAGFIAVGKPMLGWVFGREYAAGGIYLTILGIAQCTWLLRVGPTLAALSLGDSYSPMWANTWRALGVVVMAGVVFAGARLVWVPVVVLTAEVAALLYAVSRLSRLHSLETGLCLVPTACVGLTSGTIAVIGTLDWVMVSVTWSIACGLGAAAVCMLLLLISSSHLRSEAGIVVVTLTRRWGWMASPNGKGNLPK